MIDRITSRINQRRRSRWFLAFVSLLLIGCGPDVETAEVTGVITRGGEPLDQVMVHFMPDPKHETPGRHSTAVTDAKGSYSVTYTSDPPRPGAAIGSHRVTLEDLIPENYRGPERPPESRVPAAMKDPWKSSLRFEVKPGKQEFNIELEAE